jgi:hypothetical protein
MEVDTPLFSSLVPILLHCGKTFFPEPNNAHYIHTSHQVDFDYFNRFVLLVWLPQHLLQ